MTGLTYEDWVAKVPESIKRDPLWSFQVYPKALFAEVEDETPDLRSNRS